jgi:hypothetical protein
MNSRISLHHTSTLPKSILPFPLLSNVIDMLQKKAEVLALKLNSEQVKSQNELVFPLKMMKIPLLLLLRV